MEDARVGRRYAQALFDTALKYDVVTAVEADLTSISSLLDHDAEFRHFILAPYTSREEKITIAEKLFSDRVTALTMQVLRVMLEKGREGEISVVRRAFSDLRREHAGVVSATVTSAEALDDRQKAALVAKIESKLGKMIEPVYIVDPRVLGGVKVAYGSYVLDGTVRGNLNRLRDRLRHDLLKQA